MSKMFDEAYPKSKNFSAADLPEDYGVRTEYGPITEVDWQTFKSFDTNEDVELIVLKSPNQKPWVLKSKQARAIAEALGRNEDAWRGATVSTYKGSSEYKGQSYDVVVVDPKRTKPANPAASSKPRPKNSQDTGDITDLPNEAGWEKKVGE